jgi:alanine dehydrogenase
MWSTIVLQTCQAEFQELQHLALNNATLPFLVKLANKGYQKALGEDKNFLAGLNVCQGLVTYKAVADVFGHEYVDPTKVL